MLQKRAQKLSNEKTIAAFLSFMSVLGLEDKARAGEVPKVRMTLLCG